MQPLQPPRRRRGATLVEVLVSVVVLALGVLGASALQMSALRNNQGAYEHSQTTVATQSILDAMRANRAGVDAGQYNLSGWVCAAPGGSNLAGADIDRWITDLQAQINASACGQITCTGRDCTVGVRWDDARSTGGSSTQSVLVRSLL